MKTSYEVIITGDKVTWIGERPHEGTTVRGRLQVGGDAEPPPLPPPADGRVLAALMEQIAREMGGIESIPDPVAWQREQREDRPMPGREP